MSIWPICIVLGLKESDCLVPCYAAMHMQMTLIIVCLSFLLSVEFLLQRSFFLLSQNNDDQYLIFLSIHAMVPFLWYVFIYLSTINRDLWNTWLSSHWLQTPSCHFSFKRTGNPKDSHTFDHIPKWINDLKLPFIYMSIWFVCIVLNWLFSSLLCSNRKAHANNPAYQVSQSLSLSRVSVRQRLKSLQEHTLAVEQLHRCFYFVWQVRQECVDVNRMSMHSFAFVLAVFLVSLFLNTINSVYFHGTHFLWK